MESLKISIIIPTFNRAHLIGETLDSIIVQTYTNWECIIVDDGSCDNTDELIDAYQKRDTRIKYHHRPNNKPKGANSCRNIGLSESKGDYIIFFDSDDLMTPDHIEIKVNAILKYNTDFVITKTKYFNSDKDLEKYYKFDLFEINPYNYISQKINWLTPDICLKTEIGKSIQFNEQLQSGQEYNYFSKLVHKSTNAIFIDEVVTLRRYHEDSIRSKLSDDRKKMESTITARWVTYNELLLVADDNTRKGLLRACLKYFYRSESFLVKDRIKFTIDFFREFRIKKGVYFLLFLIGLKTKKGSHYFYKKI